MGTADQGNPGEIQENRQPGERAGRRAGLHGKVL